MPSEKILEQKKQKVGVLKEKLKSAASFILADYRGITVAEDTELRTEFRKADVEYKVLKNNIAKFAVKGTDLEPLCKILTGPTAIALSKEDPVSPAKVISQFAKKVKSLEIKGGVVEGRIINCDEIKNLASLPSKEELIGKVLGSLNAPVSGLANVLNANLRGLVVALNAVAEQKQGA